MKKVLVTGILGQDGANMAEFLLGQREEIEVYGMMRRSANPNFINAQNFKDHPRFKFVFGDLSDDVSIDKLVNDIKPDYFINFAANSFGECFHGHVFLMIFNHADLKISRRRLRRRRRRCGKGSQSQAQSAAEATAT